MKEKKHSATMATETQPLGITAENHGDFQDEISDELLIFRYLRAEAIADGVLIDASELAREAGFKYPVALTTAAWQDAVAVSPADSGHDDTGRLWDVLNVLRFTILAGPDTVESRFCVEVCDEQENRRPVQLKAVCGPGDEAEPVITIMLPDED